MAYTFNPLSGTFDFYTSSSGGGLTIGTTTITSGTSGRVLYDNAGVVGELTNTGTGNNVLDTSPTLVTPTLGVASGTSLALTSFVSSTQAIGAVSTDGVLLTNTTAASAGAQKWSPRIHFTGSGWKTTATAASQVLDAIVELQPVEETTAAQMRLVFSGQTNGGGYKPLFNIVQDGVSAPGSGDVGTLWLSSGGTRGWFGPAFIANSSNPGTGLTPTTDGGAIRSGSGLTLRSDLGIMGWSSTTNPATAADTILRRGGAAVVQFGSDVNGAAVNQTLAACNGITGTDKTGGNFTINTGKGTGAGAVSSFIVQTPTVLASGTTAQSLATRLTISSAGAVFTGGITLLGGAVLLTTSSALTNGAGVAAGTLTTAPVAGNPTKWIGINDNGTTRYIPAW